MSAAKAAAVEVFPQAVGPSMVIMSVFMSRLNLFYFCFKFCLILIKLLDFSQLSLAKINQK
jgi:hypothetical protein